MSSRTIAACTLAWLVPGGGHLFLQRWKRGVVFLASILLLFFLGLQLQGRLFALEAGFFGMLKFIAGVATGLLYFAGRAVGLGVGDVTAYGYEYGNTFLYTAGLLNMLLVVDAFDIAEGRKS